MNKIYGVITSVNSQVDYYESDVEFNKNDHVIISTKTGLQYGKVVEESSNEEELSGNIERLATDEDYDTYLDNLRLAKESEKRCKEYINQLELNMNIINSKYNFDRTQLLFNFTSSERVDFRELAKKLASTYHTRIELHQIGARDKAREVGGIGICGKKLCCCNVLKKIDGISMNMAKNQNIALNPSKINGVCGRLLCCLAYEDGEYQRCAQGMPQVGKKFDTPMGNYRVESVDILNRTYKVTIDGEKKEFKVDENC